jgi:hypothetical protein
MEFALHYRGKLSPKATAAEKHRIRQHFHPQLKKLWEDPDSPLKCYPLHLQRDAIQQVGAFQFAPFVCKWANLLAELEITLLRPEPPGGIVQYGGDIDNRLKTLFDAMAIPSQLQQLPPNAEPAAGENPFFCVLDDDRRITGLTIHTERLWEPVTSPDEVELLLLVRTTRIYDLAL